MDARRRLQLVAVQRRRAFYAVALLGQRYEAKGGGMPATLNRGGSRKVFFISVLLDIVGIALGAGFCQILALFV